MITPKCTNVDSHPNWYFCTSCSGRRGKHMTSVDKVRRHKYLYHNERGVCDENNSDLLFNNEQSLVMNDSVLFNTHNENHNNCFALNIPVMMV